MTVGELGKALAAKRILIVDDQNAIRSVVKAYFVDLGFQRVDVAIDGQDALKYLAERPYDIVVCDWQMPKLSGLELLQQVRSSEQLSDLPFLMMTSVSDTDAVHHALACKVSDYMIKPFQPAQLGFKVIKLLNASKHLAQRLMLDSAEAHASAQEDSPQAKAPDSAEPESGGPKKGPSGSDNAVDIESLL